MDESTEEVITHRKEPAQSMLTDAKLLTRLQSGDAESFETLFLRHYDRVYGILYRLLGNRADAEDVAQQVFLKLYRRPHSVSLRKSDDSLSAWLYRVAVNTGYNALRGKTRRRKWYQVFSNQWDAEMPHPPTPADHSERAATQSQVRQVLALLKPRDAKLLLLRHSGLSYKELAETLGVAPGSVGSLLSRAERAFEKRYRSEFPAEEYPDGN